MIMAVIVGVIVTMIMGAIATMIIGAIVTMIVGVILIIGVIVTTRLMMMTGLTEQKRKIIVSFSPLFAKHKLALSSELQMQTCTSIFKVQAYVPLDPCESQSQAEEEGEQLHGDPSLRRRREVREGEKFDPAAAAACIYHQDYVGRVPEEEDLHTTQHPRYLMCSRKFYKPGRLLTPVIRSVSQSS